MFTFTTCKAATGGAPIWWGGIRDYLLVPLVCVVIKLCLFVIDAKRCVNVQLTRPLCYSCVGFGCLPSMPS